MTLVVPKQLVEANARFVLVKPNRKEAFEVGWKRDNNYAYNDQDFQRHIAQGGNYGVLSDGNLHQIDIDDSELFRATGVKLPASFTAKRGTARRGHYYFTCSDIPEGFRHKHITEWGDIRLGILDSYVVGPGCTHPSGEKYEINTNLPIAHLTFRELLELFPNDIKEEEKIIRSSEYKKGDSDSLSDKLNLRCIDIFPPDRAVVKGDEVVGAHPDHGSTTGANFSINTAKNTWICRRHHKEKGVPGGAGGPLELYAMKKGLLQCEDCGPDCFDQELWGKVLKELENDGYEIPQKNQEEVARDFLKKNQITPDEGNEECEKNIERAKKLIALPLFPEITHPLFKEWMTLASELSYSRVPFHFFTLASILSVVLGNRVCVNISAGKYYANLYILLLGSSSISGKSYAIDLAAKKFIPAITKTKTKSGDQEITTDIIKVNIMENKITEPRLVQDLSENETIHWTYDEAQSFFSSAVSTGNNSMMLPQICKIYDGKKVSSKLSTSTKKIEKDNRKYEWECETPFVSLLFAMTIDQFNTLASSEQKEGGFLPRIIPVVEEGGEIRENVDITEEQAKRWDRLTNEIKEVALNMPTGGKESHDYISFGVCKLIEEWKVKKTNQLTGREHENKRTAISRAFIHAYKLAMIMTIFDRDSGWLTSRNDVIRIPDRWAKEALAIVDGYTLPRMVWVLAKANEENKGFPMSKIIKLLHSRDGSTTRSEIGRCTHIQKSIFKEALESLVENHEIVRSVHTKNGRSTEVYSLC